MVITTIQVSDETRKKLQVIKQNLNLRNVDEVLNKLLDAQLKSESGRKNKNELN